MLKNFELTQSSLKDFINLPRDQWVTKWINKVWPYERVEAFIYGSLLDGFLFDPESLPKKFATYRGTCKPSDTLQAVIGLAVKKFKSMSREKAFIEAAEEVGYGQTWKNETLLNKFTGFDDYIKFCEDNKNKTVVMYDYVSNIRDIARYLVNHAGNNIQQYILKNPSEDYRNEFQKTLRGNIKGVPCKIIIDILHFDEINSTVRDVDFKTTYDIEKFKQSIDIYGYNTQLSFYQEILKQNPQAYAGYTLIEPMNVVFSKKNLDTYVHNYFGIELDYCKFGDSNRKGWLEVVDEIATYLQELKK